MTIKPYIIHLTEVTLSNIKKSEKKVVDKFLSVLHYIDELNTSSKKRDEIISYVDSLKLKTYRGGNKNIIQRKLNQLTNYLKNEHSLFPEGYYVDLGMILGSGFGLALGLSLATALGFNISIGISIGMIVGLVSGIIYGIYMDASARKSGKMISLVSAK